MLNNLATDKEKTTIMADMSKIHDTENNTISGMKVISWNINSVRARLPMLKMLIDKEQPDVILLQETKCTNERFPNIPGYHKALFGQKSYNGVAILSKKPLKEVESFGENARCIKAMYEDLCLMSIYIPCGEGGIEKYDYKRRFLTDAIGWIAEIREKYTKVIIGGDFNVAMTDADVEFPEKFTGSVLCRPDVRNMMSKLTEIVTDIQHNEYDKEKNIKENKMTAIITKDADSESANQDNLAAEMQINRNQKALISKNSFTWWDYRTPNRGFRIDYIFSAGIKAEQKVLREYRRLELREFKDGKEEIIKPSDHAPIFARILEAK